MKIIPLHNGGVALVDDQLYDYFIQFVWSKKKCKDGSYYVCRYKRIERENTIIYMAEEVMRINGFTVVNLTVDHINGKKNDNQFSNLKAIVVSTSEEKVTLSKYKGVSWDKVNVNWKSMICVSGKQIDLGSYKEEEAAALAYDNAVLKYFGPNATHEFNF